MSQALLPNLQMAETPRIAILSTHMASTLRAPGGSYVYRASKAAALNLGRNLATDLAPLGIAVGIYHPGWVLTEMGGPKAELTVEQSVAGLLERFEALTPETSGVFEARASASQPSVAPVSPPGLYSAPSGVAPPISAMARKTVG